MYRLLLPFILSFIVFVVAGCNKDRYCGVPHGDGAVIDLTMPDFYSLNHPGGYMAINRGNKGIFIRCTSIYGDYVAYEMTCPKDNATAVEIVDGYDGSLLQCPRCHSIFMTDNDGTPVDGAATPCSLYQYNIHLDDIYLNIY